MPNILGKRLLIVFAAALTASGFSSEAVFAARESIIHNFSDQPDGSDPRAALISDASGNLYGTTLDGGTEEYGTIFKVTPKHQVIILHSFGTTDGEGVLPYGGLVMDALGNLYGTTSSSGSVFKLAPGGKQQVLHHFTGGKDGADPHAGLILDSSGILYGTTISGGGQCPGTVDGCGTVFKLKPNGRERLMYSFPGGKGGSSPMSALVRDAAGNFYGTTARGGTTCNCGLVFKLTPRGHETVLHRFGGVDSGDGNWPGELTIDSTGVLYGVTSYGGIYDSGTIFKLTPDGHETVLYSFTGGADGGVPVGGLVRDGAGNLYGVTTSDNQYGYGLVFKLNPSGKQTVLHTFTDMSDGAVPEAGLLSDGRGGLYGISDGGTYESGTIFKVTLPRWPSSAIAP